MKKIKKVTAYKSMPGKSFLYSIIEYDINGNVTKSVSYESENTIESKTLAKYDQNNNIVEEINYMTEDEIAEKLTYIRDEKGKLLKVIIKYSDGSSSTKNYEYTNESIIITIIDDEQEFEGKEIIILDSKGRTTEKTIYDYENKQEERQTVEYDDNDFVVNRKEYNRDNELDFDINYSYDKKGNLLKYIKTNNKNEIVDSVISSYDEKGNLTEQKVGDHYFSKFIIDSQNKTRTEERYDMTGKLQFIMTTKFSENDLITEEITPEYTIEYKYEFY